MSNSSFYGIEAITLHLKSILISFFYHQLVLGFVIGFIAATGIYALLLAEEPKHIPIILAHKQNVCFQKIATKNPDGTYATSYTEFEKNYNRVKTLFYASVLVFLLIIGGGLILS